MSHIMYLDDPSPRYGRDRAAINSTAAAAASAHSREIESVSFTRLKANSRNRNVLLLLNTCIYLMCVLARTACEGRPTIFCPVIVFANAEDLERRQAIDFFAVYTVE